MERFRSVLPEGSRRARIRLARRESLQPVEGTLDDTLGEEACGMVERESIAVLDREGTWTSALLTHRPENNCLRHAAFSGSEPGHAACVFQNLAE